MDLLLPDNFKVIIAATWWKYVERPVRFWWQRRTRGFDESELWSLDCAVIEFVYPRLKALRELPPAGTAFHRTEVITEEGPEKGYPRPLTREEWDAILAEILVGFKIVLDEDCYPLIGDQHAQLERSMDLFREYFFAFWD